MQMNINNLRSSSDTLVLIKGVYTLLNGCFIWMYISESCCLCSLLVRTWLFYVPAGDLWLAVTKMLMCNKLLILRSRLR